MHVALTLAVGLLATSAGFAALLWDGNALPHGTVPGAPTGAGSGPAPRAGWAVHTSLPASHGRTPSAAGVPRPAANYTNYTVCNSQVQSAWMTPCWNYTIPDSGFCAQPPLNATLADLGLNLSVATTPATGVAPAPAVFAWNITVNGGGMPPYLVQLVVYDAAHTFESSNGTGTLNLSDVGLYYVDVLAIDSSCSQTAYVSFPLEIYGALGPNPISITTSLSSVTVPSNATYQVNTTGLPSNVTVLWTSPGTFGQSGPSGTANLTYYVPGTYSASACLGLLDGTGMPTGILFACADSTPVTLGGISPVVTNASIGTGPYPENVTYSAAVSVPTTLPNGTELYLIAYDAQGLGTWVQTNGSSLNLTLPLGCGRPWTTYVPPSGICTYEADWSLLGPLNGADAGFLGSGRILANLTANGTPSLWNPAISWSHGPLNGTLPFNLTVNLTASGGAPPYSFSYTVYGRSNGSANATLYPTLNGTRYGWNGSAVSILVALNQTGVYYASYFVADSDDSWTGFALPLVILGNVSPLSPLVVRSSTSGGSGGQAPLVAGVSAWFVATPSGGAAPYDIQWAFGDGSFGSSLPGVAVAHTYPEPGTYDPTVTVTDAQGRSVRSELPPIHVVASTVIVPPAGGNLSVGGGAPLAGLASVFPVGTWIALGATAATILALGIFTSRREIRRQGELLVEGLAEAWEPPGPPAEPPEIGRR